MITHEIESDIRAFEQNAALYVETNFSERTDALDFIDFHIIDRIEGLPTNNNLAALKRKAEHIKCKLEKINVLLFERLRENIRDGVYTGSSFKKMIEKYNDYTIADSRQLNKIGYDNVDVFINGLLSNEPVPEPTRSLTPEMVFYQKTPARSVMEMTELLQFTDHDVFVDIGSGLGQATMLVNLLTGVTARGIEYEPAYCNYAEECALELNLHDVTFINTDALDADYSRGTIFFLYTPFWGTMLQDILEILRKEATKRTIKVVTYGPCSDVVARQTWLECVNGSANDPYVLCVFNSLNSR